MSKQLKAFKAERNQRITEAFRNRKDFYAVDPVHRAMEADPVHRKIMQRLNAAMTALPETMHYDEKIRHPTVMPLIGRLQRVQRAYGADRRNPWEPTWMPETPEQFVAWLNYADGLWCLLSAGSDGATLPDTQSKVLHDAYAKALGLARMTGLPVPPEPPQGQVTAVVGDAYLLKLREWCALPPSKTAFRMSVFAGFAVGGIAVLLFIVLSYWWPWTWLIAHKNSLTLQITMSLMLLFTSLGSFVKAWRKWCFGVGAFSLLILLLSLI